MINGACQGHELQSVICQRIDCSGMFAHGFVHSPLCIERVNNVTRPCLDPLPLTLGGPFGGDNGLI